MGTRVKSVMQFVRERVCPPAGLGTASCVQMEQEFVLGDRVAEGNAQGRETIGLSFNLADRDRVHEVQVGKETPNLSIGGRGSDRHEKVERNLQVVEIAEQARLDGTSC